MVPEDADSTTPVLTPEQIRRRNREQIEQAMSAVNRWYAGLGLHHDPTPEEAVLWYIENGGAVAFAQSRTGQT